MFDLRRREFPATQYLYPTENRVERRPKLVRERSQEKVLLVVSLFELRKQIARLILSLPRAESATDGADEHRYPDRTLYYRHVDAAAKLGKKKLGVSAVTREQDDRKVRPHRLRFERLDQLIENLRLNSLLCEKDRSGSIRDGLEQFFRVRARRGRDPDSR
jgi:hypothetical protein